MTIVQGIPDPLPGQPVPDTDQFQDRQQGAVLRVGTSFVESILGPDAWKVIQGYGVFPFFRAPIITGIFEEPSTTTPSLLTCEANSFISQPKATITYKWDRGDGDWIDGETESTYQTQEADIGLTIRCFAIATNAYDAEGAYSNQITVEEVEQLSVFEFECYAIQGMADSRQITVFDEHLYLLTGITNPKDIAIIEAETYAITGVSSPLDLRQVEAETYVVEYLP